jgi:hypothetical protein
MSRRHLIVTTAALVLMAPAAAALAGGWAITSLDELPAELRAGSNYEIGYTILQHGRTPVAVDETAILIHDPSSGNTGTFAGVPDGPIGHYVAEVAFPESGTWEWQVAQGYFAPHELGSVSVQPPRGAVWVDPRTLVQWALIVAAALSAGVAVVQLSRVGRPARHVV